MAVVVSVAVVACFILGVAPTVVDRSPLASGPSHGLAGGFEPATTVLAAGTPIPASPKIDPPQTIVLSENSTGGTPPLTYVWYAGTYADCSGDTDQVGTGPNLTISYAAGSQYYCYAVNQSGSSPVESPAVLVDVETALTASSVTPASPTIDLGTSVVFTAHPQGGVAPYSADWFTAAPGSPNCTGSEVGTGLTFTVKPTANISYCYGASDSSDGTPKIYAYAPPDPVTIDPALQVGPVSPASPTLDSGQSVALSASPHGGTGPGTYTVQWYTGTSSSCSSGMTAVGTNATTYNATPSATTGYCYSASDGSYDSPVVYSAVDTVKINSKLVANPVSPKAPGVDVGQTVTLKANATGGTPSYRYQWYYSYYPTCSVSTASNFTGQTNATFTETPGSTEYVCYSVTDSSGTPVTLFSAGNLVTVNPLISAGRPSPLGPTIDAGQSATLTASASGGTSPYTYQWFSGPSSTCSDDTTSVGTAASVSVSPSVSTFYCYEVHDNASGTPSDSTLSATDEVNVNAGLVAGAISPTTPTIDTGQTITLTANATGGTPVYTYLWYSGTSATCTSDTVISGQTGSTLKASPRAATYYCYAVTDGSSDPPNQRSATDEVLVSAAPIASAPTPKVASIDLGQATVLTSAGSAGTLPYTFYWFSGASATCASDTTYVGTGKNLSVNPSTATYYCYWMADSSAVRNNISSPTDEVVVNPVLTAGPVASNSTTLDNGQSAMLNATASGGTAPLHYQWFSGPSAICSNDTGIHGANTFNYTATPTPTSGIYYCYAVTDSSAGSPAVRVLSPTYRITVGPGLADRAIVPDVPVIALGGFVVLTANTTGGTAPVAYSWWASASDNCSNATPIQGATSLTYNASPRASTYYCFHVVDHSNGVPAGAKFSAPDLVTVLLPPAPTFLGFPVLIGYLILGIIIGVFGLIGFAIFLRMRGERRRRGSAGNFL